MAPIRSESDNGITPTLVIEAWHDPLIGSAGHDPRSAYANAFWLPILGPSSMAVARKLMEHIERHPDGSLVDVAELAASVGLPGKKADGGPGRNGRITSTLLRLHRFGLIQLHPRPGQPNICRVKVAWPPLTRAQAERLPMHVLEQLESA